MTKQFILLFLLFTTSTLGYGQTLGDYYVSVASDSSFSCRLKFLNDSVVELSNVPRHMGRRLSIGLRYINSDSSVEILPRLTEQDSLLLITFGLVYFTKPLIELIKIKGGFIDYKKSLIYVRQKDFGNNPDVAYIIDGKTYVQDVGVTDGYGLIRKSPRQNKALQKKLKNINKDNSIIEVVQGLEAYKRFGIKRVYGAVVIMTKPKY